MIGNPPPVSPYTFTANDYLGRAIKIVFNYDNTTRALLDSTIQRDQGCLYGTLYIGVGADGTVEATTHKIPVPSGGGQRTFAAGQLNAIGLHTIEDVLLSQITAAA